MTGRPSASSVVGPQGRLGRRREARRYERKYRSPSAQRQSEKISNIGTLETVSFTVIYIGTNSIPDSRGPRRSISAYLRVGSDLSYTSTIGRLDRGLPKRSDRRWPKEGQLQADLGLGKFRLSGSFSACLDGGSPLVFFGLGRSDGCARSTESSTSDGFDVGLGHTSLALSGGERQKAERSFGRSVETHVTSANGPVFELDICDTESEARCSIEIDLDRELDATSCDSIVCDVASHVIEQLDRSTAFDINDNERWPSNEE